MIYENTLNGHQIETGNLAWFGALLFGPLYFLYKGMTAWFFISFFTAIITAGISHFVIPLFVYRIAKNHYGEKGYKRIE